MTRGVMSMSVWAAVALVGLLNGPALAQTAGSALTVGRVVTGTFAEGAEPVLYSVEAGEDTFLLGEVQQISVDVAVRILDPEGEVIGRFDGPDRGPERFSRRLRQAGAYQIEVAPFEERDRRLPDHAAPAGAGRDRPVAN